MTYSIIAMGIGATLMLVAVVGLFIWPADHEDEDHWEGDHLDA